MGSVMQPEHHMQQKGVAHHLHLIGREASELHERLDLRHEEGDGSTLLHHLHGGCTHNSHAIKHTQSVWGMMIIMTAVLVHIRTVLAAG